FFNSTNFEIMPKKRSESAPGERAKGKPLSQGLGSISKRKLIGLGEINMIINCYKVMKAKKEPRIRDTIHELLGPSKKKIGELWTEYNKTKKIPLAKKKEPWNKGKRLVGRKK